MNPCSYHYDAQKDQVSPVCNEIIKMYIVVVLKYLSANQSESTTCISDYFYLPCIFNGCLWHLVKIRGIIFLFWIIFWSFNHCFNIIPTIKEKTASRKIISYQINRTGKSFTFDHKYFQNWFVTESMSHIHNILYRLYNWMYFVIWSFVTVMISAKIMQDLFRIIKNKVGIRKS